MKILLVSMPSIHVIRWIENLKSTDHDLYWFDVMDRGTLNTSLIPENNQFVNWKKRKISYIKGEYVLSKKAPKVYSKIQPLLEVTAAKYLQYIIETIKPDLVHSFEMQSCSYPILKTMLKFPNVKWLYSCWGSDLYYYKKNKKQNKKIKKNLQRIDYLITDCKRDYKIAKDLGFNGDFLGVIPGGGGFKKDIVKKYSLSIDKRKIILIKGYEHKFGRALNCVKALENIQFKIKDFDIVIFGAHDKVKNYVTSKVLPFKAYNSTELDHRLILELMGKSLIYVGNSISDGIPNTLLEAIALNAFPIQSNPGNATEEYINNCQNGLLIFDAEEIIQIQEKILYALNNFEMIKDAFKLNKTLYKDRLEYKIVNTDIIKLYSNIEKD